MKISITIADTQHVTALTALSISTFLDTFSADNRKEDMDQYIAEEMNEVKLVTELRDADNRFFLVWYNNGLIGYAKMRTQAQPKELACHNPIEIERIYVRKEYHDKKVGAALMDRCISHAISQGHDLIWLGVWEFNYKAVKFYERYGFEKFGSHIFRLGTDDQTDILMKKELGVNFLLV